MKSKIIVYIIIAVVIFLGTSLFVKQCEIEKLQREISENDFEDFQNKIIIANQKIRSLKILNKNLSKDLIEFEKGFDNLNIENKTIDKKLKAKKAELEQFKIDGKPIQELLTASYQLNAIYEKNKIKLELTIKNLIKQKDIWKEKYNLQCQETLQYKNLYLDCSDKYQELYKLKFKPDNKYKYVVIVETALVIVYLFLKK